MGCYHSRGAQERAEDDGNQATPGEQQENGPSGAENGPGMNTPREMSTPLPEGLHTGLPERAQNGGANRRPTTTPTPKVHNTKTVRSVVNLKKHTLRLLRDEGFEEGSYRLQFTADSSVPAKASIYIMAYEKDHSKKEAPPTLKSKHSQYEPSLEFDISGLEQSYITPAGEGLPLGFFTEEQLTASSSGPDMAFPIVIRLQPIESGEDPNLRQAQTTFATLVRQHDWTYTVQALKQLLWVDGTSYVLHEIFGVEGRSSSNVGSEKEAESAEGSGKECVVCLSEARNTLVLPCRHLCLCNDCAKALRYQSNKCPICRTTVQSFLQIKQGIDGVTGEFSNGTEPAGHAPTMSENNQSVDESSEPIMPAESEATEPGSSNPAKEDEAKEKK